MRARLSCCTASQVSIASVCWSRIERTTALVLSVFSAAGGAGLEGGLGFAGACAAAAGVTTSPTATTKGRMLLSHSIGTSCLAFIRPGRSLRKRKSKASQSYPETAYSSRTSPSRRTKRLASISEKISGGHSFRTLANGPSVPASTPSSEAVDDVGGFVSGGLERHAVADQLDAEEETRAAHVADQGTAILQIAQRAEQVLAHAAGVRLESVLLEHVEHGQAGRARHRVAAERAEELHPLQGRCLHHRHRRDPPDPGPSRSHPTGEGTS